MTATSVHVTIGVLTYKRPHGIAKLLEVVRQQKHDPARPYRLSVVVDDDQYAFFTVSWSPPVVVIVKVTESL